MVYSDWALIGATLLGPVLAVQAQKWVERARDRANRKRWIIYTLMSTRGARLAQEHVGALNSIDLTFYGLQFFWIRWQWKKERIVVERWRTYLNHLNTQRPVVPGDAQTAWDTTTNDYFFNLLDALLVERHFDFDLVQIQRGAYSPTAHYAAEWQNLTLRTAAIEWLSGRAPVRVNVAPDAQVPAQVPAR